MARCGLVVLLLFLSFFYHPNNSIALIENNDFLMAGESFEYFAPEQSATTKNFRIVHRALTQAILSVALAEVGIPPALTAAALAKIYPRNLDTKHALYGFRKIAIDDKGYVYCRSGIKDREVVPDTGDKRGKLVPHTNKRDPYIEIEYYLPKNTSSSVLVKGHAYVVGVKKELRDKYVQEGKCEKG